MLTSLVRLSFSLAATRLIAITMPMADVILLTHLSPDYLSAFALGAQWAQIGVVGCGALSVAITITLPRCIPARRSTWLPVILSVAALWGVCITLMVGAFAAIPTSLTSSGRVTAILAAGMVPLSIYASLSSFNQCFGQSKQVLGWTALAGILNLVLDVVFIKATEPAAGVAWATTLCWSALCVCAVRQTLSQYPLPARRQTLTQTIRLRRPWKSIRGVKRRALTKIALPDFLSKAGFVGSMALGFWWLSSELSGRDINTLAAALSYMNLVFVVIAAVISAFGITFLQTGSPFDRRRYVVFAGSALLLFQVAFFCFSPITAYIYFADINRNFLLAINLATLVVLIDGAALFAITLLRIYGVVAVPPYLRLLMFPCAALLIAMTQPISFKVVMIAMLFGNAVVFVFLWGTCKIYSRAPSPCRR